MKLKVLPSILSSGWSTTPEQALTPGCSKMASLDRVKVLVLGDSGERFNPPFGAPDTFELSDNPLPSLLLRSSNDLAPAVAESPLKV